jgi:tetratricopeptide (TPR) repeat protein
MRVNHKSPRRPALALAAAAMAALIAACGGPQSRFDSYVQRGKTHYAQGDFKRASLEFRNAMQINPRDPSARLLAGHAAEKLGQVRQAASLYQSALDLDRDNVEALGSLARLFSLVGAPQRALDTVSPGLAKHPDDPLLLTVRASARAQLKDTAGAVADADRALKLAPDNQDALALRAGLYQSAGDTRSAITLLSSALQRHPESADLHETLASLYLRAGETSKTEEELATLVRLKPEELRYRAELAIFLTDAHRIDDAQRVLEEAVRALPKNDNAKLTLANFIVAQRDRAQGEKTLRRFIDQQPDNHALRLALGDLLWQGGADAEALAVYGEVIHRDASGPSGLIARDRIAAIYLAQHRPADAEKLLKEVLDKSPHDAEALFMRAQLSLERSDTLTAVADLRTVLRDNPQSVPAQRLLARAYVAQGAFALAEESLRAALDLEPRQIPLRLEYAQLLMRTGRSAQGIEVLEETVRANPQDSSAREALVNATLTQRDYVAALAAAKDLETLRPDYAAGPYLEGLALRGLGRTEEARQALLRALARTPGAIEPLTALAHLEIDQGHGAAAIERVQTAMKAAPADPALVNLLGDIYIAQKDYPRAVQTLQGAIKLAPQWWPAYRTLALAQVGQRDDAGAIATYEAALKLAPSEPQLVIELGHLYVRSNRSEDAIKAYEALYQRSPQLQIAANNLALLLITYRTDRVSLDRARDLTAGFASSDNGTLLDTNGWVRVRRQEYEAALPVLERAAEHSPEDRGIRYHLAMAQMHLGQTDRARTNLQTALAGSANYPWAADARAALAKL